MKLLPLLVLLFSLPCLAQEQKKHPDWPYRISQGILIGGAAFDFISSAPTKHTREATAMGNNRWTQLGMIGGTTALTFWMTHSAHKSDHRKAAIWGNVVLGGVHIGAACWNVSLTMRLD
jgi:hypothetical protein